MTTAYIWKGHKNLLDFQFRKEQPIISSIPHTSQKGHQKVIFRNVIASKASQFPSLSTCPFKMEVSFCCNYYQEKV